MAAPLSYFFFSFPLLAALPGHRTALLGACKYQNDAFGKSSWFICLFVVCIHVCELAHVWVCMCVSLYVWTSEADFSCPSRSLSTFFYLTRLWSLSIQVHWPASKLPGYFWLLLAGGSAGTLHIVWLFKMWIPGLELRSLCLINKHFANIAISLAPNLFPFWKHFAIVVTPNELKASILKMSRCNCNL